MKIEKKNNNKLYRLFVRCNSKGSNYVKRKSKENHKKKS